MRDDSGPDDGPAAFDDAASDSAAFEAVLRERLHAVADGIPVAPGALERLHRTVPARRRRRRRVGLAATTAGALAVVGAVVPAARSLVTPSDHGTGTTVATQPVAGADGYPDPSAGTATGWGAPADTRGGTVVGPSAGRTVPTLSPTAAPTLTAQGPGVGPGPGHQPTPGVPSATPSVGAPGTGAAEAPCGAADLAQGPDTGIGAPGADGTAYGVVELRNVSGHVCAVTGQGVLVVTTPPGSVPVQVSVVAHVAGDTAPRLPLTAPAAGGLNVAPGQTYELQFAWTPQAPAAGATGCGTAAVPVPTLGYAPADGSTRVAAVRLTAACGGSVVRTDVYVTGAYPRA